MGDDIKQAVLLHKHAQVASTALSWSVRVAQLACRVLWQVSAHVQPAGKSGTPSETVPVLYRLLRCM